MNAIGQRTSRSIATFAAVVATLAAFAGLGACRRPSPAPASAGANIDTGAGADAAAAPAHDDVAQGDDATVRTADATDVAEPAEALWHEPVAERAPATEAAQGVMDTLHLVEEKMTATRYQHRTEVRVESGIFYWDCAGMVAWVLDRAAPTARAAVGDDRPAARNFHDTIARSPTDEPRRGWLRLESPEDIGPGDVFAWLKPEFWPDRPNTGHVGFVIGTPQPHPEYVNVWVMRTADATRMLHEADSRPEDGEGGFGTATMAFLFDDAGIPVAYGWYGAGQVPETFVPTQIVFGLVSR